MHPRYSLTSPAEGSLHVREDVVVEQWEGDELVVLAPEPFKPQERVTLEFPGAARRRAHVCVLESRPAVLADGAIRHRLRLAVETRAAQAAKSGATEP
jgi:hypothetical protein